MAAVAVAVISSPATGISSQPCFWNQYYLFLHPPTPVPLNATDLRLKCLPMKTSLPVSYRIVSYRLSSQRHGISIRKALCPAASPIEAALDKQAMPSSRPAVSARRLHATISWALFPRRRQKALAGLCPPPQLQSVPQAVRRQPLRDHWNVPHWGQGKSQCHSAAFWRRSAGVCLLLRLQESAHVKCKGC